MRSAWIIFAAALAVAACQPQKPTAPVKTAQAPAVAVTPPPVATPAAAPTADCPCADDKPTVQKASTGPRKRRHAKRAPVRRAAQPPVSEREYARPPADYSGPGYAERRVVRTYGDDRTAPAYASRDQYGYLNWPGKVPARP